MFDWLAAQPPAVATFLGTLTGSSLGLVALLIGAFANASLNRKRDDRLREEEARSIRTALIGELTGLQVAFNGLAEQLEKDAAESEREWPEILVPDLARLVRVMPVLLPKFGHLPQGTVRLVIDVYATVEQVNPTLALLGGIRHSNDLHTQISVKHAARVAQLARSTATRIDAGLLKLNARC